MMARYHRAVTIGLLLGIAAPFVLHTISLGAGRLGDAGYAVSKIGFIALCPFVIVLGMTRYTSAAEYWRDLAQAAVLNGVLWAAVAGGVSWMLRRAPGLRWVVLLVGGLWILFAAFLAMR